MDSICVPVSTTLSTSAPNCSRGGDPPFTVTIRHECTTSRPIYALVYQNTHMCAGVQIRDPWRSHRRIGPSGTLVADEYDPAESEPDYDTELVRLEPGHFLSISYAFSVVPKVKGLRSSDVRNLVPGNQYGLTLRKQKWMWMFEDEMPENCTQDKVIELLKSQKATEWTANCSAVFEFTD